jgi:mannose-6-phosphate isomerase-like protein (cupin superfamily)
MTDASTYTKIPNDDPQRNLTVADAETLPHIAVVGDTYTILVHGKQTAGRYCLIDMHIPKGGGPPLHRHNFEENFTVLHGEILVMFRDTTQIVRAGESVNIPANAPTISPTPRTSRHACTAPVRRRGRKSSSCKLVYRCRLAPRLRRS